MRTNKYRFNQTTLSFEVSPQKSIQRKKVFGRLILIFAFAYFIIGYGFVFFGNFELQDYINVTAIVGGIASTVGLISLFSSRINKNDIEEIGIEYFKDVVEASENLQEKERTLKLREQELGVKEKELKELEIKKAELEFLVQKASLIMFLKDQLQRSEKEIVSIMTNDKVLNQVLFDRNRIIRQLNKLKVEIESNNETEKVQEIIDLINKEKKTNDKIEVVSLTDIIIRTLKNLLLR